MTDDRQQNAQGPWHDPGPATGGGDWRDVTAALHELGACITRATRSGDSDENRRRLQELSAGLADLASRIGAPAQSVLPRPAAQEARDDAAQAAEGNREIPQPPTAAAVTTGPAAERLNPRVLDALQLANEKFRQAAQQWETPAEAKPAETAPATPALMPGVPAPAAPAPILLLPSAPSPTPAIFESAHAGAPEEVSVQAWLYPETAPAPEAVIGPQAPAAVEPQPLAEAGVEPQFAAEAGIAPAAEKPASPAVSPEKLDAVRIAHERFMAERRIAEAAAAASLEAAAAASGTEPASACEVPEGAAPEGGPVGSLEDAAGSPEPAGPEESPEERSPSGLPPSDDQTPLW